MNRLVRCMLLVVLGLASARTAPAGGFSYSPPVRWVTAYQKDVNQVLASDSLWQGPATPWADFTGHVGLDQTDGFAIVGTALQESRLLPTQIWAHGYTYLDLQPRLGVEDEAKVESYLRVGFSLTEAHDATMHLFVQESDDAGGATGSCGVYVDGVGYGGTDPGTNYDQPVHLAAGPHVLEGDVDVYGLISPPSAANTGVAEYFFVLNLDGGTAGVAPGAATSVHVLANPVRGDARIAWSLARPGPARLRVFDLEGRVVATLLDGDEGAGPGLARWSTAGVAPGLYLARLEGPGFTPIVERVIVAH